jgi:hypothetical protein
LHLLGGVVLTAVRHQYDVPAELGTEWLANLSNFQAIQHLLELRQHLTWTDPPQVSAIDRAGLVIGFGLGRRGELVPVVNPGFELSEPQARLRVAQQGVWFDQDMARSRLIHHRALPAAPLHHM